MIHKWWAAANCKSGSVKIIDRTGWISFGSVSTHCCTVIVGPFLLINTVPRKFKLARFTFFAQPFFVLPLRNALRNVAWRHKERLWSGLYWSDVTLLLHAKARFSWNLSCVSLLSSLASSFPIYARKNTWSCSWLGYGCFDISWNSIAILDQNETNKLKKINYTICIYGFIRVLWATLFEWFFFLYRYIKIWMPKFIIYSRIILSDLSISAYTVNFVIFF